MLGLWIGVPVFGFTVVNFWNDWRGWVLFAISAAFGISQVYFYIRRNNQKIRMNELEIKEREHALKQKQHGELSVGPDSNVRR